MYYDPEPQNRADRVLRAVEVVAIVLILILCAVFVWQSRTPADTVTSETVDEQVNSAVNEAVSQAVTQAVNDAVSNIVCEPGDTYQVDIQTSESASLLAASKTLLSAVSIRCTFTVQTSGGGFYYYKGTSTTQTTTAGSGVIYKLDKEAGDAYVITNYHVVFYDGSTTANEISDQINLYLYGQEYSQYAIPATYVGGSMYYDIAVLKVENSAVLKASNACAVDVADSDDVSVLETAIAVGNPEGEGLSATVGHVNVDSEQISMTSADNTMELAMRVIRIDTAVNAGNSGGGLYNDRGQLIGIVNAKMNSSSVDNIAYAIPSNVAIAIADNILDYCADTEKENVYRCMLGITVQATASQTYYDQSTGKVHIRETVSIVSVNNTGIANGKLQVDDVIKSITIEGTTYDITRTFHIVDKMLNARVGDEVTFTIERAGQTVTVDFDITEDTLTTY